MTVVRAREEKDWVAEAQEVLDKLAQALSGVGIVLPSLRLEHDRVSDDGPLLIDLGRCNLRVARELSEALERAGHE
ncbi:hypothetical protein ACFWAN_32355 [Streptomyces mirabilis]|uniref:hypothetical protein n=1 Tax=Streptomyces mirabilis TaxID=68239 RepID=UPI0036528C77